MFADFQTAVLGALKGHAGLVAIVGTKIFDDVPHASESAASDYPRVSIGEQSGEEDGAGDVDAAAVQITLHAWSRLPGRNECLRILDCMRDAVHNKSLFVSTGVLVRLDYMGHETLKEADGETYHGIVRFEGLYQYG